MGFSGMNYASLIDSIKPDVIEAIRLINNPEIAPEIRQLNQEILLREVGQAIYAKVYDMNAFDMEVEFTKGTGIDNRYYGLAKVASGSVSNGSLGLEEYITNYLQSMAAKAQTDAFTVAKQTNKRPTVTRTESAKACQWCKSKTGTFTDPPSDVFHRHGGCGGKIVTKGFKSRNGELKNYKKPEKIKVYRTDNDSISAGGDLFGEGFYVYRNKDQLPRGLEAKELTLNISPKQIYTVSSDAQYQAMIKDAQRQFFAEDTQKSIPKLMLSRGFKAVEGTPGYDPLAGIAVYDKKLIK